MKPVLLLLIASSTKFLILHYYYYLVQIVNLSSSIDQIHLIERISCVSLDLHFWMKTNRLNLNPSKTQLIWFGTRQQLLKLDHKLIASTFPDFTFSSSVRDLGVTLDSELT